jgi:predicted amidohydrolase
MSKFVKIGNLPPKVGFAECYTPEGSKRIISDLKETLNSLRGKGFDLLVGSEALSWAAQRQEDAEKLDEPGELISIYQEFAKSEKCCVMGAVRLNVDDKIYNALAIIDESGKPVGFYAKNTVLLKELDDNTSSGHDAKCFDLSCGRCGATICLDLNTNILLEQYRQLNPQIMAFSTMFDGGMLQSYWAFQLESFMISSIQTDESRITDPLGQLVAAANYFNPVASATINLDYCIMHLDYNRIKFDDIYKKYGDEVKIDIPPAIGRVILYSQSPDRTAEDIMKEFELMSAREYFTKTIAANQKDRQGRA